MFCRRTSSNRAFCFVFKTLMSKNRENKWSISETVISVCCVYLMCWPNKYIFINVFFMHPQYVLAQLSYEVFEWLLNFWKAFLDVQKQDLKQHPQSRTSVHLEHNIQISWFFDGDLSCIWLAKLRLKILVQGHLRGIQAAGWWISWQAGEAMEMFISYKIVYCNLCNHPRKE